MILARLARALGNGAAHGQRAGNLDLFAAVSRAERLSSQGHSLAALLSSGLGHSGASRKISVLLTCRGNDARAGAGSTRKSRREVLFCVASLNDIVVIVTVVTAAHALSLFLQ